MNKSKGPITRVIRTDIGSIETLRTIYQLQTGQEFYETKKCFQIRDLHGLVINIDKTTVTDIHIKQ